MMFARSFPLFALSLVVSVHGHALITPALGVQGAGARSDVQRANNNCGNTNVAQTIDSSTAVKAAADGSFSVTATDFNAGRDGSRSVSGTVDTTGAGRQFSGQVTISQNGNANPNTVGSDKITAQLPAGTTCTGGASGNKCLVSFKTTAGFGNCVVVQQGGAGGNNANAGGNNANAGGNNANAGGNNANANNANTNANNANANANNANANANNANANANANNANANANTGNRNGNGGNRGGNRNNKRQPGTRAARSLLAELADLEARSEEGIQIAKRGMFSWIWA